MKGLKALEKLWTKIVIKGDDTTKEYIETRQASNIIEKELKALEIIKELKIMSVCMLGGKPNLNTKGYGQFITQEQYDLLKEVLKND